MKELETVRLSLGADDSGLVLGKRSKSRLVRLASWSIAWDRSGEELGGGGMWDSWLMWGSCRPEDDLGFLMGWPSL